VVGKDQVIFRALLVMSDGLVQTGTGKGLVPYVPYVNPYRVPPKIVNSGLGAGANPAGAGGGADNPVGG
jgi:hypothetical protein